MFEILLTLYLSMHSPSAMSDNVLVTHYGVQFQGRHVARHWSEGTGETYDTNNPAYCACNSLTKGGKIVPFGSTLLFYKGKLGASCIVNDRLASTVWGVIDLSEAGLALFAPNSGSVPDVSVFVFEKQKEQLGGR